jgi:Undecaprenyl-phosphate glucose phosphotransferase
MDVLDVPQGKATVRTGRKMPGFLSASSDILLLCDVCGGLTLGYLSSRLLGAIGAFDAANPVLREALLGSVLAALVLREPRLAVDMELFAPARLLSAMTWRAVAAMSILAIVGLATRGFADAARLWLLVWCALFFTYACLSRRLLVAHLHRLAMRGALREAVAVVGAPDVAAQLASRLAEQAAVVRVIDPVRDTEIGAEPSAVLRDLLELARSGAVDTVVVALGAAGTASVAPIVEHLKSLPVQVTLYADGAGLIGSSRKMRLLSSVPISVVADRPLDRWDLFAKWLMDKAGAVLLLLLFSPIMLAAALAVACDSPGPILFRQPRSGWSGRLFTINKFRTMRHEPSPHVHRQTIRNDQRLTRIGALLRRSSFDELPQLWNVLCGDMSLVGPRPHADVLHARERAGCTIVAEYAQRQRMKPGLTGWAQIHGARGGAHTAEALRSRIAYDLYYIDHWSIGLDLLILARTPWALLRGDNAY